MQGNAAGGVPRKVDHSHLGAERDDVAVFERKVDGDVASHELGKYGFGNLGEQLVSERIWRSHRARDEFGVKPMRSDLDFGPLDQLTESAAVVGVGVGNSDRVNVVQGESQVLEAAGYWEKASLQPRVDQDGPAIFDQHGDPGSEDSKLEDSVGDLYGLAEDHGCNWGENLSYAFDAVDYTSN